MKKTVKAIWGVGCYPLLYVVAQLVISVICSIVAGILYGISNAAEIANMTQEQMTGELAESILANFNIQIPMIITAVLVFLIMWLFLKKSWRAEGFWRTEHLNVKLIAVTLISGVALNFFTIGFINLTGLINYFPEYGELMSSIVGNNPVIEIISVGLLIPLIEELIFRGAVFSRLRKITRLPVAIIIQALLFGLIHFNILQSSYAFILGIILGLVCVWLDSIWASVALHISYNLTSLIASYSFGERELTVGELLVMTFAGIVGAAICLYACVKWGRKKTPCDAVEV